MKLLWFLVLAVLACRLLTGRWPWQFLGGKRQAPGLAQARNLLGLGRNANRIEIIEAHKRLVATVHPDRGGTNEAVYEANAARDLLLAALAEQISE